MKIKIPPVVVFLIFSVLMFLLAKYLPVGQFDFFGRVVLSYILGGAGVLLGSIAVLQFLKNKTTVDPINIDKANKMVITGLYKFSRNPMYLALLLVLIAIGLQLQNAFNTILAAAFVYFMNHFQILPEEVLLEKKFGKEFRLYKKAVRRWF
ncbi:isoprenylcysteine carboxyl methyltransferase [Croceivirga lutea]|uniref:methyltransferase family protein n=1 Tax=Croceivirga lutea TaxID=1775167 RepID=UPI001639E77C|nr:isoprenylcysteine carboxylmethyltransferase family protein [Croceivirga lutea]GGG47310.1 isoprenylcysteine carboxyl methyltransferase [Croceivirga lutea]